jgi:tRNA wybutosine-synthesizing protein 3
VVPLPLLCPITLTSTINFEASTSYGCAASSSLRTNVLADDALKVMTTRLLQPDYDDDSTTILPSFASLRRRTLDTLYPAASSQTNDDREGPARVDKSPKGSVDEHIQSLVDLINQHPSFSTLSSCSGRISLFDPHLRQCREVPKSSDYSDEESTARAQPDEAEGGAANDDSQINGSSAKSASGKGGAGGWLFVSHDEVADPLKIVNLLDDKQTPDDGDNCTENGALLAFKVEPMLLHVAAASLERGQQLLQVALRTGFRESGLVVTSSRVTVAVRSHSLALHVPLSSRPGPMRPSDEYLVSLVGEGNRRLRTNMQRIRALYDEIESSLFQPSGEISRAAGDPCVRAPCNVCAARIPDLKIWGQTAVAVPEGPDSWSLLAFGGYGDGPESSSDSRASNQRSGSVFRLQLSSSGEWRTSWERLETSLGGLGTPSALDLDTEATDFVPREGLASCILQLVQSDSELTSNGSPPALIMLFGGRTSPTKPLDELLLCQYRQSLKCVSFVKPTDIRGQPPSPRWGHTVTPVTGEPGGEKSRRLALVFGGRNETEALASMHVISLREGERKCHLIWESVVFHGIQSPMRRFHHDTVLLNDCLFVLGGLKSTSDLLEPLRETSLFASTPAVVGFSLDVTSDPITASARVVKADDACFAQLHRFGHRASVLGVRSNEAILCLTGGVPVSNQEDDEVDSMPLAFLRVNLGPRKDAKVEMLRDVEWASHEESFDLGTLVHHDACVVWRVGGDRETATLVVVGGGVPGFGFRPCFAHSHAFTIASVPAPRTTEAAPRVDASVIPSFRSAPTAPTTNVGNMSGAIAVAHVRQHDAKAFKEWLVGRGFLDMRYRMAPANRHTTALAAAPDTCIAVPMTREGWEAFDEYQRRRQAGTKDDRAESMLSAIVDRGMQALPRSTRTYARHRPVATKAAHTSCSNSVSR